MSSAIRKIANQASQHPHVLVGISVAILIVAFTVVPLPGGDDWEVFNQAARNVLRGSPIYGVPVYQGFYYYNAPWLAVLITPLTLLPSRFGWGILSAASFTLPLLVARRWMSGLPKAVFVLTSPPMFYILLHGQVDALVLAGVLLPRAYWGLVALTKPQVGIGLLLGGQKESLRLFIITALVLLISFLWFGFWPLEIMRQPAPVGEHNIWLGLWPFQVAVGIGIAFFGINRKDERFLLTASPFFLPYAATSSLLGPWIVLCSTLKSWQVGVVSLAWWAAVVYRFFGGIPF